MYHSHLLGITLDYSRHWLLVLLREISIEAYDVLGDSQQRKAYDAERADFHRRHETSQGRQAGMRSQKGGGEVEKKGVYWIIYTLNRNKVIPSFWVVKSYTLVIWELCWYRIYWYSFLESVSESLEPRHIRNRSSLPKVLLKKAVTHIKSTLLALNSSSFPEWKIHFQAWSYVFSFTFQSLIQHTEVEITMESIEDAFGLSQISKLAQFLNFWLLGGRTGIVKYEIEGQEDIR